MPKGQPRFARIVSCQACGGQFHWQKAGNPSRWCDECRESEMRRLRREATARYTARNGEKVQKQNRERKRRTNRQKRYGVTEEQFAELKASQEHRCRICLRESDRLHVDHCHETGNIRGLLCFHCNAGLGHFRDDPSMLMSAIRYLDAVTVSPAIVLRAPRSA